MEVCWSWCSVASSPSVQSLYFSFKNASMFKDGNSGLFVICRMTQQKRPCWHLRYFTYLYCADSRSNSHFLLMILIMSSYQQTNLRFYLSHFLKSPHSGHKSIFPVIFIDSPTTVMMSQSCDRWWSAWQSSTSLSGT